MNVKKCESGHFYDADLYAVCPHCPGTAAREPEEKHGGTVLAKLFHKEKKKEKAPQTFFPGGEKLSPPTELLQEADKDLPAVSEKKPDKHPGPVPDECSALRSVPVPSEFSAMQPGFVPGEQTAPHPGAQVPRNEPTAPAEADGHDALCEKTVGWFCAEPGDPSPCVGWLVGLSGKYRGRSLELKPGRNSVGRGAENTVDLSLDNRVSRGAHAYIVYEPRKREYYIESGKSRGIVYVNGNATLHMSALTNGDTMEIGGGSYLFVPLCGNAFSWENYPEFRPICRDRISMGGQPE